MVDPVISEGSCPFLSPGLERLYHRSLHRHGFERCVMDQPLLRVKDAQLLQVSKWTIYRWIDEGRLDATKIGTGSLRVFRRSRDGAGRWSTDRPASVRICAAPERGAVDRASIAQTVTAS